MALLNLGERKRAPISLPVRNSVLISVNSPYLQAWQSAPVHLSSKNVKESSQSELEDRERKVPILAKGSESIAFHITCIRERAGVMMQSKTLVATRTPTKDPTVRLDR